MTSAQFKEKPFAIEWPEPDPRFLRDDLAQPPQLPLEDVLGPVWAEWIICAAEAKASPPDYVLASLLTTVGALICNTRWASPWPGWNEPPTIWAMAIGAPSANKSPGLDAVLAPLNHIQRNLRDRARANHSIWKDKAEVAKLVASSPPAMHAMPAQHTTRGPSRSASIPAPAPSAN